MKRRFIPIDKLEIFDDMHILQEDGSFVVDEERDGQSTQSHIDGINYVKQVIENGQKIMPILVRDNHDGTYQRLDGFKRAMAQKELGYKFIEAFICATPEYEGAEEIPFLNSKMRCYHGGQPKENYALFEGGEKPEFNYGETLFLYKNDEKPHGLRIEVSDCIHVHWGEFGRYRLALGERDFLQLAEAISKING